MPSKTPRINRAEALAELQRRIDAAIAAFTPEAIADGHAFQASVLSSTEQNLLFMCSRRAGKTFLCCALLALTALRTPDVSCLYLALTSGQAKKVWARTWKRLLRKFNLPAEHSESDMTTTFPSGSQVVFGGTDDMRHVQTLLGDSMAGGMAIADECFPAGTLVDGRPIEAYEVGDMVRCVDHVTGQLTRRRIVRLFRKTVALGLTRVTLSSGGFTSTATHPVFAKGRGYVHAEHLRAGDLCVVRRSGRVVQGGVGAAYVLQGVFSGANAQEQHGPQDAGMVWGDAQARLHRRQPDALGSHSGQGLEDAQANQALTQGPRRQWQGGDCAGEAASGRSGLASACGGQDRVPESGRSLRVGLPDLLQAGRGGRIDQDMYRGRWSKPFQPTRTGCEEDGILEWARVEGVSRDEPRSAQGIAVYNLEVEGAHTYFADDVLVHNCQSDPGLLESLVVDVLGPMLDETTAGKPTPGRLVLAGTVPETAAGYFWKTWVANEGVEGSPWRCVAWSRFDNPHEHDNERHLAAYLRKYGLKESDPIVQRNWRGARVFDSAVTAYRYNPANAWTGVQAPWLASLELKAGPQGKEVLVPLVAVLPPPGVDTFSVGLDPASKRDRYALVMWGWGKASSDVWQIAEWVTPEGAGTLQSQWAAVLVVLREHYVNVIRYLRDAGSASETIDLVQRDYHMLVEAVAKGPGSLKGRVDRFADLLGQGRAHPLAGSQLENDLTLCRWDQAARERGKWQWSNTHHGDVADAGGYGLVGYYDAHEPKAKPETYEQQMDRQFREAFKPPVAYGYQDDPALAQLLGETGPAPEY